MSFHTFGKKSVQKIRDWTFCEILFLDCEVTMSSQLHFPVIDFF